MKKNELVLLLALIFALSGCVVRGYTVTKDRVDQNLREGNLGYLQGSVPESERTKERKATRKTNIVEFEFQPLIKFEGTPKEMRERAAKGTSDQDIWGNRGFMSRSERPETGISQMGAGSSVEEESMKMEQYRVQKGDTLQKISQKHFGTSKNWYKIFKANQDILKGPDKIYPGQVINIPVEPMKETEENLK